MNTANIASNIIKPDAVFFDWDGTLVDTYSFLNEGHCQVLSKLGKNPFTGDEFKHYFGRPREILYREIYGDDFEHAKTLFTDYVKDNAHKVRSFDGADQLLKTLQSLNIPVGIVSNKHRDYIERELQNFGWDGMFCSIVGAGEAEEDKPSSAPLKLGIERAGLTVNHNIWYVGDTESDLRCAADLPCPAIFIKGHHEIPRFLKEYTPLLSVATCHEIQSFLVAI